MNSLIREIPRNTHEVSAPEALKAGATHLKTVTTDPKVLRALEVSYSNAVRNTLYLAVASIAIALPFASGMEWKNVKKVSADRKVEEESVTNNAAMPTSTAAHD